jgi:hypothetical protein
MFASKGVSDLTRKQVIIIGIAICISLLLALLSYLESKAIVPGTTSMTGLYVAIFFVWPCLASASGALIFRDRKQPGIATHLKTSLSSIIAMLELAAVGICAILAVNARVADRDVASILQTLLWHFKDTSYLLIGDVSPDLWLLPHETAKLLLGIFASFVCFACAGIFSTGISRPKTAAVAGCFHGLVLSGTILHCWIRLDLLAMDDVIILFPSHLLWILGVMGFLAILILSCTIFLNSGARINIRSSFALAVASAAAAFFLFAYAHRARLSGNSVTTYDTPLLAGDGKGIVANVFDSGRNSLNPRIWRIPLSGGDIAQLGGRFAYNPALSPDGNWIGYLSQGNILGLAKTAVDLRAVQINGSGDHLIASDLVERPYFAGEIYERLSFSPDSSRIALICDGTLIVTEPNKTRPVQIALPQERQWFIAGWNSSGTEVLVAPEMPPGPLLSCNAAKKQVRVLVDNRLGRRSFVFPWGSKGIRYVLLGNLFIDLSNGKEHSIAQANHCEAGISADQSTLVYAASVGSDRRSSQISIHWRELSSGDDHIAISSEQGCLEGPLLVSPEGTRLVAWDCAEDGQAFVANRDGDIKYFPENWRALGWINKDEVAFWKRDSSLALATANAADLNMKILRKK